jgi:hypothetical protein
MVFPVTSPWRWLQKPDFDRFEKLRVFPIAIQSLPVKLTLSRNPNRTNPSSKFSSVAFESGDAASLVFPRIREANDGAAVRQTEPIPAKLLRP